MTYEELLRFGVLEAKKHNMEEESVRFLLLETFPGTQTEFYLVQKEKADEKIKKLFLSRLEQFTINKIPIQHLLGYAYFYRYKFIIDENVLIPRRETEELLEHMIHNIDEKYGNQNIKVLDLGSGSGCIGLTLKKEIPNIDITLADISDKALDISKLNGKKLNVEAKYIKSDWFSNIKGTYDIIVSNPPYIPNNEELMDIVKKEPNLALFGGIEGLDYYEHILKHVKKHVKNKGMLFFEHGFQHREAILNLAKQYFSEAKVKQYKDLQGEDRFTILEWEKL